MPEVTEVYQDNSTTSKDEEILVVTTINTIEEVAEEDLANNTMEQEEVDTTAGIKTQIHAGGAARAPWAQGNHWDLHLQ